MLKRAFLLAVLAFTPVASFAQVIQTMGEVGELKAPLPSVERFVDLQYLKAAGMQ